MHSVEKRETALNKMLTTVMKDKEKIEQTIEELDRYKRDALQKTWEKVNGCVFLPLLPISPPPFDVNPGTDAFVSFRTI